MKTRKNVSRSLHRLFNRFGLRLEKWLSDVFPSYLPESRRSGWATAALAGTLSDREKMILRDLIDLWMAEHAPCYR